MGRLQNSMKGRPGKCLVSKAQIDALVCRLAKEISDDYKQRVSIEEPLLLVGILKGAVIFMSDLARALTIPAAMDFMAVSSYGASTTSSGIVRILHDLDTSLENRHVLVVEDIVDTGLTLNYLREHLGARQPKDLRIVSLLDKPERRLTDVTIDYVGMEIPDEFVVGYGLDWDEKFRNLPCVRVLE